MDIFRNARQNFLRRQEETEQADLERQQARTALGNPEMLEHPRLGQQLQQEQPRTARSSPVSSVLRRFADLPRPSIPSFVSRPSSNRPPRPTSSSYDDASNADEIVSPKTPQFALGMPPMPSTRLHLPDLQRTWTMGSSGPPSRPGTSRAQFSVPTGRQGQSRTQPMVPIVEPVPLVPAQHIYDRDVGSIEEDFTIEADGTSRRGRRRRFDGADPAELHLASMADDGRRRRRRHNQTPSDERGGSGNGQGRARGRRRYVFGDIGRRQQTSTTSGSRPKRFMYCFPYIQSRRMRAQILRSCVSGTMLAFMLAVFLALLLTHNIYNSEFAVLLILVLLLTAIFFAHSLVRLAVLVVHPPTAAEEAAHEDRYLRRRNGGPFGAVPNVYGPGGYAIPHRPIPVVLARDEEAVGLESVTTKIQPPAYGLWRESVRVDPNRIFWQRNEEGAASATSGGPNVPRDASNTGSRSASAGLNASPTATSNASPSPSSRSASSSDIVSESSSESSASSGGDDRDLTRGRQSPRPPSYISDDGVQYVVEAQPRSIAPTSEVPLPQHPAEAGRIGRPAQW